MKNGVCPKCNGTEIYQQAGSKFAHEMIELKGGLVSHGASPDRYICASCGYLEYYLPLADNVDVIRENWKRVAG